MQLEEKKIGGILVVKPLKKRIDASASNEFKKKMNDWIQGGNRLIVLNLENVDFIDSSGLGAIISSLKAVGDDGKLVICGIGETVMSLFRLTRMDRVFQIFHFEKDAVAELAKG
jgi:anti-sigma B factor antagonist